MSAPPLPMGTADGTRPQAKLRPGDVGLTDAEYAFAVSRVGRDPSDVELGMLGALWSEHCAYKHSRPLLRRLPSDAPQVIVGPGENAGAVDLGGGLACVFKVESHNHPSAVEPFQGAATGVGGIVRDIFTMGARPVALLNALFFGDPGKPRTRYLAGGVVGGISFYGNCLGIPDVGGHVSFDPSYDDNPLVNAMCVGVVPTERITRATGAVAGDAVYLIGADTGRDGIAGASLLASFELGSADDAKRPSVQVGDPFLEKLVMEACLELIEGDHVAAMQDLGAAGLACAVSEVAAKARAGIELDVRSVPRRASGMTAYEVMLSESQERMLVVPRRGHEGEVERIAARWRLHCTRIGTVVAADVVRVRDGEATVAEISARLLADDAPIHAIAGAPPAQERRGRDSTASLLQLLADANVCSRERIYRRYDQMVGIDTVLGPGADAAVLRLKDRPDGIAVTIDANPDLADADPQLAAAATVAEACRNLLCVGARPLGLTDCINAGNPERPHGAWQLTSTIDGLAQAGRALELPFVSGNVSLYNASAGRDIVATAVVGAVGAIDDVSRAIPAGIGADGDTLLVLGATDLDLDRERRLHRVMLEAASYGRIAAAHDVGVGGIAVAVAEMAIRGGRGAHLHGRIEDLFARSLGSIVLAVRDAAWLSEKAAQEHVPLAIIGVVGGARLIIDGVIDVAVAECENAYRSGLAEALELAR